MTRCGTQGRREYNPNAGDFVQYRARKAEISLIRGQLQCGVRTADRVQASEQSYPYMQYHTRIEGIDRQQTEQLRRRIDRLTAQCAAVDQAIEQIAEAQLRVIVRMRYVAGESWERIGEALGLAENTVRVYAWRFFKKNFDRVYKNNGL